MPLERRTITYQNETHTRYFARTIESLSDIIQLSDALSGNNYFYGAVIRSSRGFDVFFGDGPDHDIFEQLVHKITGSDAETWTVQIGIEPRRFQVAGIVFHRDPGITADGEDNTIRRNVITALANSIPQNCYSHDVPISSTANYTQIDFFYNPDEKILTQWMV